MSRFSATSLSRYVRTVRHLKAEQIVYRILRRIFPTGRIPPFSEEIGLRDNVRMTPGVSSGVAPREENSFSFLNVDKRFPPDSMDWASPEMSKLWRYNLHYFNFLHEKGRSSKSKSFLINDWITENPQGTADSWEPFPVSLRIVNWIRYFLSPEAQVKIYRRWLLSLYEQSLWLEKNIEYHLLANHLFKNGKALFFAGLFFIGPDADRWLNKGMNIICSQIEEQVLPDGGHFERSPMYHAMILEDCLDLLNICQGLTSQRFIGFIDQLHGKTLLMANFLLGMTHPDGDIALFNDAAFGIEAPPNELVEYLERLSGIRVSYHDGPCRSFPDSGYFVMSPTPHDRLIIDCGPVGPDYQPGHSHCDTLSFELSLKGRRVIVDSGCGEYLDGEIRRYNRGNSGHNTLTIDSENQSEVWGAHRCGRRARPLYATLEEMPGGMLRFMGAHDGYRHLTCGPVHKRTISWFSDTMTIDDMVTGEGRHDIELRLHINPELRVEQIEAGVAVHGDGNLLTTITAIDFHRIKLIRGWYCPGFGSMIQCPVLSVAYRDVALPFHGGWQLHLPQF
jgi:uncharacterized heparinase superfamily protein